MIADIQELFNIHIAKASKKEEYYYYFISGKLHEYPQQERLSEIEEICLSVFCKNAPNKESLATRIRLSKPIKGFHYSNNLIELTALAIHSIDDERENIKNFCLSANTQEVYLINRCFNNICSNIPMPKTSIEQLAYKLLKNEDEDDWSAEIYEAMKNVNSIIDIFIIEEAYRKQISLHPNAKVEEDVVFSINVLKKLILVFKIVIFVAFIILLGKLSTIIFVKWDFIEPAIWVIALIAAIIFHFFKIKVSKNLFLAIICKIAKIDKDRLNIIFKKY